MMGVSGKQCQSIDANQRGNREIIATQVNCHSVATVTFKWTRYIVNTWQLSPLSGMVLQG